MSIATAQSDSADTARHPYDDLTNVDTNYATWFEPEDVDETENFTSESDWYKTHKQTYWKHLDSQHRGHKNGGSRANKPFQTYLSNRHLSETIGGALDITKSEEVAAEKWFRRLHFDKLGYDIRLSGFCVCLYLVKHDERDDRSAHPNLQSDWPPEFRQFFDSLPKEQQRRLFKAYGKIAYKLRSWTVGEDEPASNRMDKFGVSTSEADIR